MDRRRYLASIALALSTAGCLSSGGSDESKTTARETTHSAATPSTTMHSSTTPSTTPRAVSVADVTLQRGLTYLSTDYLTVHDTQRRQLLVHVVVDEGDVPVNEYAVVAGDDTFPARSIDENRRLWRTYQNGQYDPTAGGVVIVPLPLDTIPNANEATFATPNGERALPDGVRERLAAPAPSAGVTVDGPTELAVGTAPTFDVTVTNDGDVAGRYPVAISRSGPLVAMKPIESHAVRVDADTSTTIAFEGTEVTGNEVSDDDVGDDDPDVRYTINTHSSSLSHDVRYVEREHYTPKSRA